MFYDYHLENLKNILNLKMVTLLITLLEEFLSEFGEIMVMVLKPIISKALFNHVGNSFVDDRKFIIDILSMDKKVSLSSSRNRKDKDFMESIFLKIVLGKE